MYKYKVASNFLLEQNKILFLLVKKFWGVKNGQKEEEGSKEKEEIV